jgi:hypothetical protein
MNATQTDPQERKDLPLRAHHVSMLSIAAKDGIPKAVADIVAQAKSTHDQMIGNDGTVIDYGKDLVGNNLDTEKAYADGLERVFKMFLEAEDDTPVLMTKLKDGICTSCAGGIHCDMKTEMDEQNPELDRDRITLYNVYFYFLQKSKDNPDIMDDLELVQLNPERAKNWQFGDPQDENFDYQGYRLPVKYIKDPEFLDFISNPMNYTENLHLLEEQDSNLNL